MTVYDELNMTTAANKLYMTQPSVSQAIKELESHYGAVLFERLSHKLYVTESGEKVYQYATHIIKLVDELEDSLKENLMVKKLTVGANYTVGTVLIHKYIEKFKNLYPDSEVKVIVNKASVLVKMVKENQLDIALVEELKTESDLIEERFTEDRIVIVANPEHLLVTKGVVSAYDIVREHLLLREKGAGVRELFETKMNQLGLIIEPFWESTSTTALINAAKNNMGIAVLPYQLVKEQIDAGILKELLVEDMDFTRHLTIVYHKNKFLTEAMKDFMWICHE